MPDQHRRFPDVPSRVILFALLLMGLASPASAQYSDADRDLDLQSFDQVWSTINAKHWDLEGVDWEGAREELRPKIESASSRRESRRILSQLLERLGQSHFGIIPSSAAALLEKPKEDDPKDPALSEAKERLRSVAKSEKAVIGGAGVSGLTVRDVNGAALVTHVMKGTPAEERGIRPGWEILRIGSDDVRERIARLRESLPQNTMMGLIINATIAARLNRSAGRTIEVTFRTGANDEKTLSFETVPHPEKPVRFGNMPEMRVLFESKQLEDGVGYVRITSFFDVVYLVTHFRRAIEEFEDAPGLVIDLRGNPGGIGALAMSLAGFLVEESEDDEEMRLGTMITRSSEVHFGINPRDIQFTGPLALLVDEDSASTTEIFAGGMQDLGRARVFGVTTAGAALPSTFLTLANGDQLQYAIANYISVSGKALEADGVTPDEVVVPTRERLLAEGDPILSAALRWIEEQDANSK